MSPCYDNNVPQCQLQLFPSRRHFDFDHVNVKMKKETIFILKPLNGRDVR